MKLKPINQWIFSGVSALFFVSVRTMELDYNQTTRQNEYKVLYQAILAVQNDIEKTSNTVGHDALLMSHETPLRGYTAYEKFAIAERRVFDEVLSKRSLSCIETFACSIADDNDYTNNTKQIIANYLCDVKNLGSCIADFEEPTADAQEIPLIPVVEKTNIDDALYNFVKTHHTSIATIAILDSQRFVVEDQKFYLENARIRSLNGLAKVVHDLCFAYLQKSGDQIKKVSFKNNYLQAVHLGQIKKSFLQCCLINCDKNPLISVNFTGASQGDTVRITSSCSNGSLSLNMESLSRVPPLNIYLRAASLSLEQQNQIIALVAQMKHDNYQKNIGVNLLGGFGAGIATSAIIQIPQILLLSLICALNSNSTFTLSCADSFSQAFSTPVVQGFSIGGAVLGVPVAAGIGTVNMFSESVGASFIDRYKSHYIVFDSDTV